MINMPVQIVRYVDSSQPGWVECRLLDVHGCYWSFIEKIPVVTKEDWDASSAYPKPGFIACEVISQVAGIARINTSRPWGILSVEGKTEFEVPDVSLITT
jgi:hypothetical protein